MKFIVGDRVAFYDLAKRHTGKVVANSTEKEVRVAVDGTGCDCLLAPQQCRLLKKKQRRRIWVNPENYDIKLQLTNRQAYLRFPGEQTNSWIEFVEVKKR